MFDAFSGTNLLIIIVVAALVFFGSTKIPELFRSLGKATGEFKKGKLESELEAEEVAKQAREKGVNVQTDTQKEDLEKQIKQLQDQLDQLKKQKQNQ